MPKRGSKYASENLEYSELVPQMESLFSQKIIDISPAFVVLLNPVGRVVRMNQSMYKTLGYSAAEVHGVNYLETFIPKADRDDLKERLAKNGKSGKGWFNINRLKKIMVKSVLLNGGPRR